MKKKTLAIVLAVVMVATLGACGSGSGEETRNAVDATQEGTGDEGASDGEDGVESDEADDAASNANSDSIKALYCTKNYYVYDDEIGSQVYSGVTQGVILAEESKGAYPKLYDALQKQWEKDLNEGDTSAKTMADDAREMYDEMISYGGEVDYWRSYESDNAAHIHRVDDVVFSYSINNYEDMGGAHGMYGDFGHTFDSQTGEQLKLSDVIIDLDAYIEKLYEHLQKDYSYALDFWSEETSVLELVQEDVKNEPETWSLDPDGIVFFFNPYSIGPYAAGEQIVKIGYAEAQEIFNEAYLPTEDEAYINDSFNDLDYWLDTDGDGVFENVHVYGNLTTGVADENDLFEYYGFKVSIGANPEGADTEVIIAEDIDHYGLSSSYAIFPNGKTYLLVDCQTDNDYHVLVVCEVGNGNAREVGRYGLSADAITPMNSEEVYYTYALTDPASLRMTEHFDRLSTYYAGGEYQMTDQGEITPLSDYAYINESNREFYTLTSKAEIEADIVDEDGNVVEEEVLFPAGTEFTIYRTSYPSDNYDNSVVDCLLSDGRIARFVYTTDIGGNRLINGYSEWDIFDNLLYAG